MFYKKTITAALVIAFSILQLSHADAASRYTGGYYGLGSKPTLVACKPKVAEGSVSSSQRLSRKIALRKWQRSAYKRYRYNYSWALARSKRISCGYDSSIAVYRCKAQANPCRAGTGQYVQ